jgi:hypothetical protein
MRFVLAALACATLLPPAFARSPAPTFESGEYVTEAGWGSLTLGVASRGSQSFSIQAIGANAHTCDLDGSLSNGKATLEGFDAKSSCVVTIQRTGGGFKVEGTPDCRAYCGARAGFDGEYLKPAPGCAPKEMTATRNRFQKLYDAKRPAEARAALEPLLANCARTTSEYESASIRNDLAVTFHKLKDFAACRAVLEPLAEEARMSDEQIRDGYPPADAEARISLAKSIRTNLKLCKSPS